VANLNRENDLQREAFEIYYGMGKKRSLKAVAERVSRTERTVAGWSRAYNWVDRCYQREIEDAKAGEASKVALSQTIDVKTRYRILINNLMAKANQMISEGKLAIKNVQDFERVIKLDLLLMGEPTDNTTTSSTTELSLADKERLDAIAKFLSAK
jgi:hypothetical protein